MSVKSESYNDAYSAEQKKSLDKAIAERAERIDGIVAALRGIGSKIFVRNVLFI